MQEQLDKLKKKLPDDYLRLIEKLSAGIESKGYKYTNFYATILNWSKNEQERQPQQTRGRPQPKQKSFLEQLGFYPKNDSEVIDV